MTATMLFFWGVFLGTVLGTALGYAIKAARDQHTQIQVGESKTGSIQTMAEIWRCPICGGGNAPLAGECHCRAMNCKAQNNLPEIPVITSITFKPDPRTGLIFGRFVPVKRKSDGAVGMYDVKHEEFYRIDGATGEEDDAV